MGKLKTPFCILTVAGSDSSAGAGIQADSRAILELGGFAVTAVTAVTAQGSRGVEAWEPVSAPLIAAQIQAAFEAFPIAAAKTGLLPNRAAIETVARLLSEHPRVPLVVDPVLASTSGTSFVDPEGIDALRNLLFPLASLITPNWPEAAILAGVPVSNERQALEAGKRITQATGRPVLVKGGHGRGPVLTDLLCTDEGQVVIEGPRIKSAHLHGTGCVLSAAAAFWLGNGEPVHEAVQAARAFLEGALADSGEFSWKGRGPALGPLGNLLSEDEED